MVFIASPDPSGARDQVLAETGEAAGQNSSSRSSQWRMSSSGSLRHGGLPESGLAWGRPEQMLAPALRAWTNPGLFRLLSVDTGDEDEEDGLRCWARAACSRRRSRCPGSG